MRDDMCFRTDSPPPTRRLGPREREEVQTAAIRALDAAQVVLGLHGQCALDGTNAGTRIVPDGKGSVYKLFWWDYDPNACIPARHVQQAYETELSVLQDPSVRNSHATLPLERSQVLRLEEGTVSYLKMPLAQRFEFKNKEESCNRAREALQKFHQAGWLHGDVDESNFVLWGDQVKLIDFEKAKKNDDRNSFDQELSTLLPNRQ